jgi:uncharacterized protein involved in exopolysaccharide biosynthesis
VIQKLLEAFFRHKLLILIPPLVIPLIVAPFAVLTAPTYYESWAGIWVDRATQLKATSDWNPYLTPAQNQRDQLTELLRTRRFVNDVARRTPAVAPLMNSRDGQDRVHKMLTNGLTVTTNGNRLLLLRLRADTPEIAFGLLNAVIETYREKDAESLADQAGLAITFFESRLSAAEEKYSASTDALRRYLAANPRLSSLEAPRSAGSAAQGPALPPTTLNPELAELVRRQELDQRSVLEARTSLEKAQLDAAAAAEGQEMGFQLVDQPLRPTAPIRETRKRLVVPAAGILVGLALSAALLVLLVASDRAARSEADLPPGIRVVGVVPALKLKRIPRRAGPDTTRRAIGFVAGTSLPAPRGVKS